MTAFNQVFEQYAAEKVLYQLHDYQVVVRSRASIIPPHEKESLYCLVNKFSGVVEYFDRSLPTVLDALAKFQAALDEFRPGSKKEVN